MWVTRFTVEGEGSFPTDMLRYDSCWPSSSEDASKVVNGQCYNCGHKPASAEKRQVTLVTTHSSKADGRVTGGRWASFGWQLVKVEPAYKI